MTSGAAAARGLFPAVVVAATTAVQALVSMGMMILPAIAPQASQSLGVPAALIGLQVSLLYGFAAITSPLSGGFVRRWGRCAQAKAPLPSLPPASRSPPCRPCPSSRRGRC